MRSAILPVVLSAHALLIAGARHLPDSLAAAVAGTVYGPLWPLSVLGWPVYARAEASGWSSPSPLGWAIVAMMWTAAWALVVAAITRRRH